MKFIYAEQVKEKTPVFGDVNVNQFFVDYDGFLCHKAGSKSFTVVAKPDGSPYSTWVVGTAQPEREILRIIPEVEKIEF